jgi:hypothetical protein
MMMAVLLSIALLILGLYYAFGIAVLGMGLRSKRHMLARFGMSGTRKIYAVAGTILIIIALIRML